MGEDVGGGAGIVLCQEEGGLSGPTSLGTGLWFTKGHMFSDKTITQYGGSYHQGQMHTLPYRQRNIHENVFINIIETF